MEEVEAYLRNLTPESFALFKKALLKVEKERKLEANKLKPINYEKIRTTFYLEDNSWEEFDGYSGPAWQQEIRNKYQTLSQTVPGFQQLWTTFMQEDEESIRSLSPLRVANLLRQKVNRQIKQEIQEKEAEIKASFQNKIKSVYNPSTDRFQAEYVQPEPSSV